jgi:myo-inositol-1-phosphate synthase
MGRIKIAVAGVGNCCSALLQGIHKYNEKGGPIGLIHEKVGGYTTSDIDLVAAFDIDSRKVGKDISEAIFSKPNKAPMITNVPEMNVLVEMGNISDSIEANSQSLIQISDEKPVDIKTILKEKGTDILVNLVSGSSIQASRFYAEASLKANCSFLNATPSPICIDTDLSRRYTNKKIPLAGDDILDQIGATVVHMGLLEFLNERGVMLDESYQLDVGGGAESVNTLWKTRELKRKIKTSAVASVVPYEFPLVSGSTDYVNFLGNQRDSFFWFKGKYFGSAPFKMDVRLNTVDAPNSGAVILDVIRGLKLASERKMGGPINALCSYAFKRPPKRLDLFSAHRLFKEFTES